MTKPMRMLLGATLLFSVFSAKAQDTTYFDAQWKSCKKAEATYSRVELKEDDYWTRTDIWAKSGQIQMTGKLSSLHPEVKEGYHEWFHENGQLKHKGNYLNGREVGEHLWYFTNGKLEARENWSAGVRNGVFEEFHSNGNPSVKSSFSNGLQHGETVYFRQDGTKHSEGNFLNGNREGEWRYYGDAGELLGTNFFKTEYEIEEADISFKLPNDQWSLAEKSDRGTTEYVFKRREIIDPEGNKIVPAILLYIEDASKFEKDVTLFSIEKQQQFKKAGIQVDRILVHENEDYPLTYKNAYFLECSYHSNGLDHLFYMIHLIDKQGKGVQLYFDMTTNIAKEYEKEFWTTIKSLKVL